MDLLKKLAGFAVKEAAEWKELQAQMKAESYKELYIDGIWIAKHNDCPRGVIGIDWHGAPGFGTYELYLGEDRKLHGVSEYMDSPDDKSFLEALLLKVVEEVVIDY